MHLQILTAAAATHTTHLLSFVSMSTMPSQDLEMDNVHLTQVVNHQTEEARPENTKLAYNPKVREYKDFCDALFTNESNMAVRYLVTPTKVFNYMFYQCYRSKRKTGGKGRPEDYSPFSMTDYNNVMEQYRNTPRDQWIVPKNPLGYSAINTYKSALKNLHKAEVANMTTRYSWAQIWTIHCEELGNLMKKRKAVVKKANYAEKIDHQFSSYKAHGEVPRIEEALFKKGQCTSARQAYAWTRHRFVFLFTFRGILRCESMYKAELSDLLHVTRQAPKDPHPLSILIMQIATGKLRKIVK